MAEREEASAVVKRGSRLGLRLGVLVTVLLAAAGIVIYLGAKPERTLPHAGVQAIAVSADGRRLLSAGDKGVTLWDPDSGEPIREFQGNSYNVAALAFSSNGRQAVSGGWGTEIILWDLESGRAVRHFSGVTPRKMIPAGLVTAVAFKDQGRQLVTAHENPASGALGAVAEDNDRHRQVTVWDVSSGGPLRTVQGQRVTPDGERTVALEDGELLVRSIDTEQVLSRVSATDVVDLRRLSADGRRALVVVRSKVPDKPELAENHWYDLESGRPVRDQPRDAAGIYGASLFIEHVSFPDERWALCNNGVVAIHNPNLLLYKAGRVFQWLVPACLIALMLASFATLVRRQGLATTLGMGLRLSCAVPGLLGVLLAIPLCGGLWWLGASPDAIGGTAGACFLVSMIATGIYYAEAPGFVVVVVCGRCGKPVPDSFRSSGGSCPHCHVFNHVPLR